MTTQGAIDARLHGDAPAAAAGTPVAMSAELQRLWQDVFDQSRVVPGGAARPAPEAAAQHRAGSAPPRVQAPHAVSSQVAAAGPGHATRAWPAADADAARAAGTPVAQGAMPAPVTMGPAAAAGSVPPAGTGVGTGIGVDSATPPGEPAAPATGPLPPTAPTAPTAPAAPAAPAAAARLRSATTPLETKDETRPSDVAAERDEIPPDEVIQVFQHDGTLEIVIRDSALDPQAALRCALETARQLTGDARSLRQLTLNGRTVLSHDGRAAAAERTPRALVSFRC
jgi:hypothetical protein